VLSPAADVEVSGENLTKKEGLLAEPFGLPAYLLLVYCRAAEIAVICAGVNLKIVPVVALNRVLMALTFAMPVVINDADAPWKSDPRTWLLLAGSSDPPWQLTQEPADR
jgi:hypothetical protein